MENSNCLICSRSCSLTSDSLIEFICGDNVGVSGGEDCSNPKLEAQLNILFVLKKLLQLPEKHCKRLISSHGNPSEWGTSFCLQCQGIIDEAMEVDHKVSILLQKFHCLQKRIQEELSYVIPTAQNNFPVPESDPDPQNISLEIRRLYFSRENKNTDEQNENSQKIDSLTPSNLKHGVEMSEDSECEPNLPIFIKKEKDLEEDDEYKDDYSNNGFDNFFGGTESAEEEGVYNLYPGSVVKVITEEHEEDEDEQVPKPKKAKKVYNCPICDKLFPSQKFLGIHYKKIHTEKKKKKDGQNEETLNARRQERKYKFKCPDCTQFFPSEYFRDAHQKRKHLGIDKPFQCEKCNKTFGRHGSLTDHTNSCKGTLLNPHFLQQNVSEARKDKLECEICFKKFPQKIFKDAHVKRRHQGIERPYDCQICTKAFVRHFSLTEHLRRVHKIQKPKVQTTGEMEDHPGDSQEDVDSSLESGEDEDSSNKACSSSSRNHSNSLKTNKPKTDRLKLKCPHEKCGKSFMSEILRDGHVKLIHEGIEKPFICDFDSCTKSYRNFFGLQIHKQSIHGLNRETLMCESCGKTFFNRLAFKRHMQNSHKERTHGCPICGKFYTDEKTLSRHQLIHKDQPPSKCNLCSEEFSTRRLLYHHFKDKHKQDRPLDSKSPLQHPVECQQCGKMFAGKYILKSHMQSVHLQEFKFKCTYCNAGFIDRCAHDRHLLTHTGDKPFKCEYCGKGLTRKSDLNRHLRIHTGEKPFCCEQCGESFYDGSKLNKHKKKAHGEPKFTCECGKKFYCTSTLKTHKIIHDPEHLKNRQNKRLIEANPAATIASTVESFETNGIVSPSSKLKKPRKPRIPKYLKEDANKIPQQENIEKQIIIPQIEEEFLSSESSSRGFLTISSPMTTPIDLVQNTGHEHHQYQLPMQMNSNAYNLTMGHGMGQEQQVYQRQTPQDFSQQGQLGAPLHAMGMGFLTQTTYLDPNIYLHQLQHHLNPNNGSSSNG